MTCRSDMARIRTIKPELFRHYELWELEQETGLPIIRCWCALFTVCDREGRFKWRPQTLKLDCAPFDDLDFSRVLDAWLTRGLVVRYEDSTGDQFGYIPTWKHHQVINNREAASALPSPDESTTFTRAPRVPHACPTRLVHAQGEREGKGKGNMEGKGGAGGIVRASRFTPPDPDEVHAYADQIDLAGTEAEKFIDHYTANGWKVGRSPMKDWKAAMRNWKRNAGKYSNGKSKVGERMEITRESIDEHDRAVEQAYAEYDRTFNKAGDSGLSQIGG